MENGEVIQDNGLFIGQKLFEFTLTESFESIANLFKTIQEYREYTNPDEAAWFEYIIQLFNILGFETVRVAQRLIFLKQLGATHETKALACIVGPKDDFNQIIFGLDWESYLFYAAKYHHIEWVILTNGLQFKVLNFSIDPDIKKYFKCELDEIVTNGLYDSFFTLYKIFSVINNSKPQNGVDQKPKEVPHKEKGKRVLVERHFQRKEFWTQLLSRAENKTKLYEKKTPGVESYLATNSGKKGIFYQFIVTSNGARIELYIDNGTLDWNKSTFDKLISKSYEIEREFGRPLTWERLNDNRSSIIRYSLSQYGLENKDRWAELHDQMIDAMIKFEEAFRPYIRMI